MMEDLKQNLEILERKVVEACARSGRDRAQVKTLLATKTVPVEKIQNAVDSGFSLLGENKVQELLSKIHHIQNGEWHFIGHLQTNKVKQVIPYITCLHSVDRWDLVIELDKRLTKKLDILIQVNTSNEESKYGLKPEEVIPFIKRIESIKSLNIKGFMTLAALSSDQSIARECFKRLKSVQLEVLQVTGKIYPELSMGMSQDYEMAIEEGATIIRVGTAVFGQRSKPDSYYWPSSNDGID